MYDMRSMGTVGILLEWTSLYTSASFSGWNWVETGWESFGLVMCLVDPIATHAVLTAIQVGGVDRVVGRFSPIPIRLGAFVATLILQGLLIGVGEESMPREEVCLSIIGSQELKRGVRC